MMDRRDRIEEIARALVNAWDLRDLVQYAVEGMMMDLEGMDDDRLDYIAEEVGL